MDSEKNTSKQNWMSSVFFFAESKMETVADVNFFNADYP
jgi:hypothetical protein